MSSDFWYYCVGMILAIMIGSALGGSFIKERGPKVALPVTIVVTLVAGVIFGWALDTTITYMTQSANH